MGGSHPERSFRRFVEAGIDDPPANPLTAVWEGWALGSQAFLKRIQRRMSSPRQPDQVPRGRRLMSWDAEEVISAVAKYDEVDTGGLRYATVPSYGAEPGGVYGAPPPDGYVA